MVVWNISYVPLLPVGSGMLSLKLSSQLPYSIWESVCSASSALADMQPNILYKYILGFIKIIFCINVCFCINIYVTQNIFVNTLQVSLYIT